MLLLLALACTPPPPSALVVYVDPEDEAMPAIESFVRLLGDERVKVDAVGGSPDERAEGSLAVRVESSEECAECYLLRDADGVFEVEAGGMLGKQYGLAHLLELMDYRFPHPFRTRLPGSLPESLDRDHPDLLTLFQPEQSQRGLHMHTLHPIEGLFGFWEADPGGGTDRVEAIADWVVKNRGNHLQWVSLDDIEAGDTVYEDWLARATATNELAHQRGLTTGLGVQLFGSGNLQQAFDLVDDASDETLWQEKMEDRWGLLTPAGFDLYSLSFGEFFGEDPATFIRALELARTTLSSKDDEARMAAVIHVGDSEDQKVVYPEVDGEEMIYYMLALKSDADLVPHIHTVMYYTLFDDAGGAYHHEDFSEHRQALLDLLAAGSPVAYFPESSYWVAFDNPVPLYLPVYVHSRYRDLEQIRLSAQANGHADLSEHVLFSSGWEWGYWQNDAFTLRMGYTLPESWGDLYRDWFAVDAGEGLRLAEAVVALAEAQHRGLIEARLAPYLAGRDTVMDIGFGAGIVAAPDRVELAELAVADAKGRAAFEAEVLAPLATLEQETAQALSRVQVPGLQSGDRDVWAQEVVDGIEIDLQRTRFVLALYRAVLAEDPAAELALADEAHDLARGVVDRRHADLHDPIGSTLIADDVANATIYDYGYLVRAEQLCFWERERTQAANLLEGSDELPPSCF